jgi:hypothetical protein
MSNAALLLAGWFTPAVWLAIPAMIVERGPEGLWVGLAFLVLPLVALGIGPSRSDASGPDAVFPVAVLLFSVGMLFWANMSLAGDVTAWLGWPRWYGIAGAAVGGWFLTAWPGARRLTPALLLVAALAVSLPLVDLTRASGMGPIQAWARVASQTAFRFPSTSAWVIDGRELSTTYGRAPIRFDGGARRVSWLSRDGSCFEKVSLHVFVRDFEKVHLPSGPCRLRSGDHRMRSGGQHARREARSRQGWRPTRSGPVRPGSWRRAGESGRRERGRRTEGIEGIVAPRPVEIAGLVLRGAHAGE